jgi:WD40 repeat protein
LIQVLPGVRRREKSGNEFECATVLNKHTQDVKYVEFHPSGLQLMSCSYDDTIKVWQEYDDDWYEAETLNGHESTVIYQQMLS